MVVYALTDKCNLKCIFCSNEDFRVYFKPPDYKASSFDGIKGWFEKVPLNEDNITLTGGEPTLREDLFDILDYLRLRFRKANILLLTNGRRLAYEDYAEKFGKYSKFELEIPLHSHKREVHDALTNCQGSYDQTVTGIKNALANNVPVNIRVIITKSNYEHLPDFMKFVKSEFFNVNKVIFINMRIKGRAVKNKDKLLVRYGTVRPYLDRALDFLYKNNMKTQLLHFPLCFVNEKYWNYTLKNPYKKELVACNQCSIKEKCPGVLESYVEYVGEEEFKAIE